MKSNNLMDKYLVAIFHEQQKHVVGHPSLVPSQKFARLFFIFLKHKKRAAVKCNTW